MSAQLFHLVRCSDSQQITTDRSRTWTLTFKSIILDSQKVPPAHPFTQKCTGSSAHPCHSNLHTESITELTEFILIFQVPEDIQDTLRQLCTLIDSSPQPVQDAPFVLIIACAYINAVANVNLNSIDGFCTLLHKVCDLCGSLDPTMAPRPGGTGQHWPKMDSAFDYIRSKCLDESEKGATEMPLAPDVPDNVRADENV